ncbi:hypothetical protein JCM10212_003962 [Sporobolomyces blumeae]
MDPTPSSNGPSLPQSLAEPLSSVSQLLDLLVPPLVSLDLAVDLVPSLASVSTSSSTSAIDPARFVKRQLGLVQKVLVETVWPDWERAVETELGSPGLAILERWFVPPEPATTQAPTTTTTTTTSNPEGYASTVALSSYAVLTSLLSTKSARTLRPRSLEIASALLAILSERFNFDRVYFSTLAYASRRSGVESAGERQGATSDSEEDEEDTEETVDPASLSSWQQSVKDMMSIPARVANAWGALDEAQGAKIGQGIPLELEERSFFSRMTASYLSLLWTLSIPPPPSSDRRRPLAYPSALSMPLPTLLSSPTFPSTALPILVSHILPPQTFPTPAEDLLRRQRFIDLVRVVLTDELSDRDQTKLARLVLESLMRDLGRATGAGAHTTSRGIAFVLSTLFGPLRPEARTMWKVVIDVLLDRTSTWDPIVVPRVLLEWLGGDTEAKREMTKVVVDRWGSREEINGAFDARRMYLTSVLLVLVASLPPAHPDLVSLSRSPLFLNAVSASLSTLSPLPRYLGMLVAELVSNRSTDPASGIQPLDFGPSVWDGDGAEKDKVREVKKLFNDVVHEGGTEDQTTKGWQELLRNVYEARQAGSQPSRAPHSKPAASDAKPVLPTSVEEPAQPAPKRPLISIIGSDDEDDLVEFAPRSLPPGPSEATLEALSSSDASLYQSAYTTPSTHPSQTRRRGTLRPPVYIAELTAYLGGKDPEGGKEEADAEAERQEVGLKEGEALIRRKAGWGGELKENAVNLAFALIGLQDNYEIEGFEQKRQGMLVALIASCPVEVALCVIEQYFMPSYSIAQLHTILTSLALAARELAHLPTPSIPASSSSKGQPAKALFPSKQLPPALHKRLMQSQANDELQLLATDLTDLALSDARQDAETTLPGAAREKLLSVRKVTNRNSSSLANRSRTEGASSTPPYTVLSAEYFMLPLVNRFWLYLRDTATSTLYLSSSSSPTAKGPYAGGPSSSMILQPLLMSKFFATLSILVHAARHSPTFLAVIVPETLALVVALRPPPSTPRPNGRSRVGSSELDQGAPSDPDEDLVLAAAFELVLVLLSSSYDLDHGRTLTQSSIHLVSEVQAWAEQVFEVEEQRVGGAAVGRAGRAAAGVLLRIEEILSKWRGQVGWA